MRASVRAKWKIGSAAMAVALLSIASNLDRFVGYSTGERIFEAVLGSFCLIMIPVVISAPQLRRAVGFLLGAGLVLSVAIGAVSLASGDKHTIWFSLLSAAVYGWGAYVLLVDRDVRHFRNERGQSTPYGA